MIQKRKTFCLQWASDGVIEDFFRVQKMLLRSGKYENNDPLECFQNESHLFEARIVEDLKAPMHFVLEIKKADIRQRKNFIII